MNPHVKLQPKPKRKQPRRAGRRHRRGIMAKKRKTARGSKRNGNKQNPPPASEPDPEVDRELDAIIEHNMRARIAGNVAQYRTAHLHEALAETKMAHAEARQRKDKVNMSHAAIIIEIMEWTLARRTTASVIDAEADRQHRRLRRLKIKAVATAAAKESSHRDLRRQKIRSAASATAAEARRLRHHRDLQMIAVAAAAASRTREQKIERIKAAATAAAAEAHRRHQLANQRRAIALAAAAAATARQLKQQARAARISAASEASLGSLYRPRPRQAAPAAASQASINNKNQPQPAEDDHPQSRESQEESIMARTNRGSAAAAAAAAEDTTSRVLDKGSVEEMVLRVGRELDVELEEIGIAADPELAQLQKQNTTNFEMGSNLKGAEECDQIRNNTGRIFTPAISTSGGIRIESKQRYLELDPNKTPPEATPAKQPPPEIDKIPKGSGQRSRVPTTPNGTAKGCARYQMSRISQSPDTGVVPGRLTATVGRKLCQRASRDRRNLHICGRQDIRSSRRPITCGQRNMCLRERGSAGRRRSTQSSHSIPAHANLT